MDDLQSLLDRVQRAEEGSRDLDAALCEALHIKQLTYSTTPGEPWIIDPPLTASLDAAVGLVERLLPGWEWTVCKYIGDYAEAQVERPYVKDGAWGRTDEQLGEAKTPPLALLSALLRALIAKEGDRGA